MRAKKNTVEWRWEAYNPDTGAVAKRGPIRTELEKVEKYALEIKGGIDGTIDDWNPAPYWEGLQLRIVTRTITPWVITNDVVVDLRDPSSQPTDTLV
jgi:hypothetical protein